MFSDTALLFWSLVTLAATFGVGAYQSDGAKARNLWALTGALVLVALVIAVGFPTFAARYVSTALRIVWMLYPFLTVSVVTLLTRDLRAPRRPKGPGLADLVNGNPALPSFATAPKSKWKPDISFTDAMLYLFRESKWGDGRARTGQQIQDKLTEALSASRITSWGKAHPGDQEFQISPVFWRVTEITLESNCVFSKALNTSAYDVQLCREELEANWPPKEPVEASA